jgi:hypothetical protein
MQPQADKAFGNVPASLGDLVVSHLCHPHCRQAITEASRRLERAEFFRDCLAADIVTLKVGGGRQGEAGVCAEELWMRYGAGGWEGPLDFVQNLAPTTYSSSCGARG